MNLDKFLVEMNYIAKRKGLKINDIAEGTGLSRQAISKVLNGKGGTMATIRKISDFIDQHEPAAKES